MTRFQRFLSVSLTTVTFVTRLVRQHFSPSLVVIHSRCHINSECCHTNCHTNYRFRSVGCVFDLFSCFAGVVLGLMAAELRAEGWFR